VRLPSAAARSSENLRVDPAGSVFLGIVLSVCA